MAGKRRKELIALSVAVFIVYLFAASMPIGTEPSIKPEWLHDIGNDRANDGTATGELIPFYVSDRYGYFDASGVFTFIKKNAVRLSISPTLWAAYDAVPDMLEVRTPDDAPAFSIKEDGYPFFLDGRAYLMGPEQNSIAAIDESGKTLWKRDLTAPLTSVDAGGGLTVIGLLDGSIEVLDANGVKTFGFEPGGSRLPVIAASRISSDGKRIALVSGIDPQRFLLLERSGRTYKVIHHEYLDRGFRRPVQAAFVGGEAYVAFERERGLAVYDIRKRESMIVDIGGEVIAFEDESADGRFFLICRTADQRELIGIDLPSNVFMRSRFESEQPYIKRRGDRLYLAETDAVAALSIGTN